MSYVGVGVPGLKLILIISSFALLALGIGGITIGGLSLGGIHDYGITQAIQVPQIAIGLIVAGCVLVLLSIAGMFGAIKDLKVLLIIFVIFLLLITLTELGLGITAYTLADEKTMETQLYKTWPKFSPTVHRLVQTNFVCCGRNGTQDTTEPCEFHTIGHACFPAFSNWVASRIEIIDIIAIVSAVVQIVVITFAILLAKAITQNKESDTIPLLASHRIIHVH